MEKIIEKSETILDKKSLAPNYLGDLWFAVHEKRTEDYPLIAKRLDEIEVPFSIQNEVANDASNTTRTSIDTLEVQDRIKKILERNNQFKEGGAVNDDFDWDSVFAEPTEEELEKWKAQDKKDLIEKKNRLAHDLGYDKNMSWNDIFLHLVQDTKKNFQNIKGAKEYEDFRAYDQYIKENISDLKKLGYGAAKYAELLEEKYYSKNYSEGGGVDGEKTEEEAIAELKTLMPRNKFNYMYDRLLKIAPNIIELLEKAEYVSDVYGKSQYRTQDFGGNDSFMYVAIEGLEKSGENSYDLSISHYYKQQGDMMCDPCMTVRINTEWGTMEALTFKMDGVIGRGIIKEVYPSEYNGTKVNLREKKSQNQFLNTWTSNLVKQGHIVEFEPLDEYDTKDESAQSEIVAGDIVKRKSGGTARYEVIRTGYDTMDLVSVSDGYEWDNLPIENFVVVDEDERETARKTLQSVREKIANTPSLESVREKYPITLEWSEGFGEENIGFNSLEKLESRLKTIEPPTNETYVKNKLWFQGYPHYVRVDVGLAEGDFNPLSDNLIDFLKSYDQNFDWSQFSKDAKSVEKSIDLITTWAGGVHVVSDKSKYENGDYKTIAHVSSKGVKWFDEDLKNNSVAQNYVQSLLKNINSETKEDKKLETVDYTKYLGKGMIPALGVKAFKKEDGNLWFIQYKPSTHFNPLDRSLDESKAKYKKALELGFKVKDFKAGKYGTAYILTKGDQALTKEGFESIDANSPKKEAKSNVSVEETNKDVIIDLEPLTKENPLSTQLSKLTGDSYSAIHFVNEDGKGLSASGVIVHIKTGKKFRIPNSGEYFKGIDAEYKNVFTRNKAIEEFLDSKDENYLFSNEEKAFLVQYEGYGGLEKQGATGRGLLWEYYTPELLVKKMWGLAYKYGFQTGKVLEPSVGVGNFLNRTSPQDEVTAYEISEYSSRICKILHPTANVINKSFEEHFYDGNVYNPNFEKGFDLVIGNPPYGDYIGKRSAAENKRLRGGISKFEHYFMLRGLDVLKSGGLLVYVSTANLFTKGYDKAKLAIAERADLVDAYLLPDKTFKNTKINTSLIILRKK